MRVYHQLKLSGLQICLAVAHNKFFSVRVLCLDRGFNLNKMTNSDLLENIEKALAEIRPYLIADGGDIAFMGVDDDIVRIKLLGACIGCSVNHLTVKNGVEATIKKYAPQIKEVVEVS